MTKKAYPHLAMIVSSVMYGINFWVVKQLMPDYFQPSQIIFLRILVTVILLWIFGNIFFSEKVLKSDILRLALCGVLGVAINQIMFIKGLNYTTPVNASVIQLISPILVLIFASIIIREQITALKLSGVIIGIIGTVMLITNHKQLSVTNTTLKGDIFILINTCSYALFLVFIKPIMPKYNPFTIMKWVFLFGLIAASPFVISEVPEINWSSAPVNMKLSLLYTVFGTTFITYLLITYALKYIEAGVSSYYIYIQLLVAVIIGILLGKESLDTFTIISTLLICSGVFLVTKRVRN